MLDIKIIPKDAGWTEFHMNIYGDRHSFTISGSTGGDGLSCLLTTMYAFLDITFYCPSFMESADFSICSGDRNDRYTMVYKSVFTWDEEPRLATWAIEKPLVLDENFMLKVKLLISDGDSKEYNYDIEFKEFCYALSKAFTEAFKRFGICGYHGYTWDHDFKIEQFIYMKAFALDELKTFYPSANGRSDFDKEIALLSRDML